jgi:hypothetical protein
MPEDATVRRALSRLSIAAVLTLPLLCLPLTGHAQSTADSAHVESFFDGIELDRQLAAQYSVPAPADAPTVTQVLDEVAMAQLEQEIDAALAEDRAARTLPAETPPTAFETVALVLAGLGLLVFAGAVLTLAVRELRKDAKQRRRTYRRRVKRRGRTETATATA